MPRGGKREGAGRKPGSRNRSAKQREQAMLEMSRVIGDQIPSAFAGDGHALLMAVYKNPDLPLPLRVDAAKAAIGYEKPRLASTEIKGDPDSPLEHSTRVEMTIIDASPSNVRPAQALPAPKARPI